MSNPVSSRLFLERAGIYGTYRSHGGAIAAHLIAMNDPNSYPWNAMPLPLPELQRNGNGDLADGSLTTEPWPSGEQSS